MKSKKTKMAWYIKAFITSTVMPHFLSFDGLGRPYFAGNVMHAARFDTSIEAVNAARQHCKDCDHEIKSAPAAFFKN